MSKVPQRRYRSGASCRACWLAVAPLLLAVAPVAFAQTTATWISPVSGTWSDPANWSTNPAVPNDPAADALLSATGSPYTVTLNSAAAVGSLTGTSADATLNVTTGGTLTLTGSLDLGPGTLTLAGGKIVGGIVDSPIAAKAGTLDSLSLASELTVSNGTIGTAGSFSLAGGSIRFTRAASIVIDGNSLSGSGDVVFDNPTGRATLAGSSFTSFTVGPNITVRTGPYAGATATILGNQNSPLVNQGTISARTPGSTLILYASGLSNTGTIEVKNNATLRLSGNSLTSSALSTVSTSDGGEAFATGGTIFNTSPSGTYTLSAAHAVGFGPGANVIGWKITSADSTPLTIYPIIPSPTPQNPNPGPTGTATLTGVIVSAPVAVRPGATLLASGGTTLSGAVTCTGGTLTLGAGSSLRAAASLNAGSALNINSAPTGTLGPISLTDSTANINVPLTAAQAASFTAVNNSTVSVTAALTNTGNTFPLPAGSTLRLTSTFTGGTLGTPGTPGGTVILGDHNTAYFDNVTLAANITVNPGSTAGLFDTCTLVDSHISIVGNAGSPDAAGNLGTVYLVGTGDISFDGTGTFSSPASFPSFGTISIPAGVTVRTGSQSGCVSGTVAGTLSAETPGRRLVLSTYGAITGTLQAKNGGTVSLAASSAIFTGPPTAYTLAGGTWIAADGTIDITAGGGSPPPPSLPAPPRSPSRAPPPPSSP